MHYTPQHTLKLLVLASKGLLLLDGLLVEVLHLLQLSLRGTGLALSSLELHGELIDALLELVDGALKLLLSALEDGDGVLRLLQVDDENLDFGLQARLGLKSSRISSTE